MYATLWPDRDPLPAGWAMCTTFTMFADILRVILQFQLHTPLVPSALLQSFSFSFGRLKLTVLLKVAGKVGSKRYKKYLRNNTFLKKREAKFFFKYIKIG